jgi:hypothetical protein
MPILIVLVTLFSTVAHAADIPVDQSLVVKGQGYFPVALRLHDNRLAVVLRGGAPHLGLAGRLDIVFSSDEGKTWSKPTVVIDSPADDRNPAFGQAPDGALVVAFWRTTRYDENGKYNEKLYDKPVTTWLTRSTDAGQTWSDPKPIDVADIAWGSPYGRILTLPDNSMLMNIYGGRIRKQSESIPPDKDDDNAYIYRSTDNGQSWHRFSHPGPDRFNETTLLALPDNRLLAAMRSAGRNANVWLTSSSDMGKTWTTPKQLTPPNVHPADLTLLPDHRILLTTGHRPGPFGVRALLLNPDLSAPDWSHHFTLTNDATNSDSGYPSTLLLNDGRALTIYYAIGSKSHQDWGTHAAALTYTTPAPKRDQP